MSAHSATLSTQVSRRFSTQAVESSALRIVSVVAASRLRRRPQRLKVAAWQIEHSETPQGETAGAFFVVERSGFQSGGGLDPEHVELDSPFGDSCAQLA